MQRENLWKGLAWISLSVLCWAPMFSVAKRTLPHLDAYALGTVRYAVGVAVLVALLAAFEGRRALSYDGRFATAGHGQFERARDHIGPFGIPVVLPVRLGPET